MVGTGQGGAELGVLFRKVKRCNCWGCQVVAVDKTGTLTEGKPALTDLELAAGFDRTTVLAWSQPSKPSPEHPIARAIVDAAEAEGMALPAVSDFGSVTGFGVKAVVDGKRIEIGADR